MVVVGATVMAAVVPPVFHEYEVPPDAVSIAVAPEHVIPSLFPTPEVSATATDGVFTDQMGAFQMALVEDQLDANDELVEASSLATTVGWLTEVPGTATLRPLSSVTSCSMPRAKPICCSAAISSAIRSVQRLRQIESQMSLFDEHSAISRLNRSGDKSPLVVTAARTQILP